MDRRAVLLGSAALALGSAHAERPTEAEREPRTAQVRQTVSPGRTLILYMAVPAKARGRHAAMLIVHGDAGLDEPARALARRMAQLGYVACAPDLLSRMGGSPADVRTARAATVALDPGQALADLVGTAQWLARNPPGKRVLTGQVGAIGDARLVERLATTDNAPLAAAILIGPDVGHDPRPIRLPVLSVSGSAESSDSDRITAFLKEHLQ